MGQYIDVVSGFFQSGKTSFINSYIENEVSKVYDRVLILSCEMGIEKYSHFSDCEVVVERISKIEDFNKENIDRILERTEPEYVIIEYNGVWDISLVSGISYPKGYNLRNMFMIADFITFDSYLGNMESIMVDKISNCDILVFTKSGLKNKNVEERSNFEKELNIKCEAVSHINSACSIYLEEELFNGEDFDFVDTRVTKSDFEILKLALFVGIFYVVILGIKMAFPTFFASKVERGIWIFISLLIQIVPFILLGALISGIIQVFVPKGRFFRMFEKTSVKSLFMALFMGAFFPVCDCAMVPIATSIAKKGYSIPVTITFLLASPAVNPIVILSTYYAFPNMPKMVLYRIGYGILIAFIMGLILYGIEYYKNRKYQAQIAGNTDYIDEGKTDFAYNGAAEKTDFAYNRKADFANNRKVDFAYNREVGKTDFTENRNSDNKSDTKKEKNIYRRESEKSYRSSVIKDHIDKYRFTELDMTKLKTKGKMRYVEAVIIHCRQELFKIGPYIVFGAMISSFIQVCVPRGAFAAMNQVNFLAVLMMLVCAFFISICSTSNAFIARSFYNIMPINAILAFVVMGPILDITNISVMLGTFKKKFIIGLIAGLVYIAFIVFSIMGGGVSLV